MINANFTSLSKFFAIRRETYRNTLLEQFQAVGRKIAEKLQNDQLSGRKSGGAGLNVKTGNLRDSINSTTTVNAGSITGEVYNQNATYWFWHQQGASTTRDSAFGRPTKPYQWNLPKRLFFWEYFEDKGLDLYQQAAMKALRKLGTV